MTVTQRVENILKVSREARNSDVELLIIYMQKAGMDLTPHQIQVFKGLPTMETIRRIRQKLQEQGKYEADEQVKGTRRVKSMEMQQNAPQAKPERIEQILNDGTKVSLPSQYRISED